jgi:hypothetical protein
MFDFVDSNEHSIASENTTLLELAIILAVNGHWLLCYMVTKVNTRTLVTLVTKVNMLNGKSM